MKLLDLPLDLLINFHEMKVTDGRYVPKDRRIEHDHRVGCGK